MPLFKSALPCLCLCGLAGAQPVRFEDEQTGFIWITDKQAGEQIIMSSQNLIYLNAKGHKWQVNLPEEDGAYHSVALTNKSVFAAIYKETKIVKYDKSGNLAWEYTSNTGNGPYIFIYALWEEQGYIGAFMHGSDAISATTYQVISNQNGEPVIAPNMRRIIGVSAKFFLDVCSVPDTFEKSRLGRG